MLDRHLQLMPNAQAEIKPSLQDAKRPRACDIIGWAHV